MEKPHQFVTLDALRGVAAIAVMSFHSTPMLRHQPFLRGELAVDFFFMLSGFVLTFAYQNRLDAGWQTSAFLKTRLARLYPLYALGLVLGGAFLLENAPRTERRTTVLAFLAGLVVCPSPWSFPSGIPWMFPLNFPTWSLFYEAVANVVHTLFLRRRPVAVVGGLVAVAGLLLGWLRIRIGLLGATRSGVVSGLARVLFSYGLGILLFRVWKTGRFRPKVSPLVVGALLVVALSGRIPMPFVSEYDLLMIAGLFPLLILLGASSQPPPRMVRPCTVLGTASYAIYVLQIPVQQWFSLAWARALGQSAERQAPWSGLVYMLLVVGLAVVVDRVYDAPARALLRRVLVARPAVVREVAPGDLAG